MKNGFWATCRINKLKGNRLSRGAFLTLTLSSLCPFQCSYCPLWIGRKRFPYWETSTLNEWKKFIEDFPEWVSLVAICGGEPTLIEYMPELVNWLLDRGHHVLIYTTLLRPNAFARIRKSHFLDIQATYHHIDKVSRFEFSHSLVRSMGHRVDVYELETPLSLTYSKHKKFLNAKDIEDLKWFHAMPNAPKTNAIYCGAEDVYPDEKVS
jgi:organic radical activating enzyme